VYDQSDDSGNWTLKKGRKNAKKIKEDLASEQLRRSTRAKKETTKEKSAPSGLAGVSPKKVSVSQGRNCAYLASSQAIFGNSNK
jgi:hypothetical protein